MPTQAQGAVSDKRRKYQSFFQQLLDDPRLRRWKSAKKARPQNWCSFATGVGGYEYVVAFKNDDRLGVELHVNTGHQDATHSAYQKLLNEKKDIEAEVGEVLSWEDHDGRRACRICVYSKGSIDEGLAAVARYRTWVADKVVRFDEVFARRIG